MKKYKKYKRFRKPRYCSNALHLGYSKYAVSEQDLIRFAEPTLDPDVERTRYGRVLGLAIRDGTGRSYNEDVLAVLVATEMFSSGHVWHVRLENVREIVDPNHPGMDFAVWFLTGTMPDPDTADDASKYGALSNGRISKYLDGDKLSKNWRKRK